MKTLQLFYLFCLPFSPLYGAAMKLRALLYQRNILERHKLPVPVISVGNLTMGGSGKTPTVQMISRFLQNEGYTPAVISRGYKGKANDNINVVADGKALLLSAEKAGDEPYMLAKSVPGLIVVTGKKRILPAQYAIEQLGCDILILDDGFQHMAVQRDIDVVLFNATTLDGNGRVFPGGDLREPRSALERADIFLVTGITEQNRAQAEQFADNLKGQFPATPIYTTRNGVEGIYDNNQAVVADEDIKKIRLHALSGIAHPERFIQLLEQTGVQLAGHTALKDHSSYDIEMMRGIIEKARANGAEGIITTHKDLVKMEEIETDMPVYCLKIATQTSDDFWKSLSSTLKMLKNGT